MTSHNSNAISSIVKRTGLAGYLAQAIDAAAFARQTLRFEPDATQQTVLRENPRRLILNCNRQWGKSTIGAILLAHRAVFVGGSLSLVVGPSERQSAETLAKVRHFFATAGIPTRADRANRNSLVLPENGSRIVALPSGDGKIRGFSRVSLLVMDEASRIPDPMYQAIRPSLAVSNGDIALISTPCGQRGFFYNECTNCENKDWKRYTVPASQCPRIPKAFLDEERANGEEYYAQEYECQFIENGTFLFSDADLKKLFKTDIKPLDLGQRNNPSWQCVMKPPPTSWPNIYARDE